ncbi:MAG: metallophosphoesterase family protein [Butyricicoccaceae bacterium]
MKVLVFSDSHTRMVNMYAAVETEVPDLVLHLGDHYDDAKELHALCPEVPVIGVLGNNDWGMDGKDDEVLELEGVKIFMTHGHRYRVRSTTKMMLLETKRRGCQIGLYGHTHIAFEQMYGNTLIANPGSIGMPYRGGPSYLRLIIENKKYSYEFVEG